MPLRLFQIYDTHSRKILQPCFTTKTEAKKHRKLLNEEANEKLRFIVVPGPDHVHYQKP